MWITSLFRFLAGPMLFCGLFLQLDRALATPLLHEKFQTARVVSDSSRSMGWAGERKGVFAPLDIPLVLSGNFGELRADHFHTGLDFKTQGKEGFPVLAATDGVIARVKISPFGYGKALYLSGPRGLTTVYAHLQRFAPAIDQWALDQQYSQERFELDAWPRQSFVFQQGDTIGWSGNSGGSGGPHLHFEIRETSSQKPLNPLLWDFDVADKRAPELRGLWLLPHESASINGRRRPVKLEREGVVVVKGGFRVAIDALDRLDAANNRCGIYKAEMRLDGAVIFEWELDTLDFAVNRDMNAHAYFPVWNSSGEQVHRMHRLPGNRLPIYPKQTTSGIVACDSLTECQRVLAIHVWDVHGNAVQKSWDIVFQSETSGDEINRGAVRLNRSNTHILKAKQGGVEVMCPPLSFYDDFALDVAKIDSVTFQIGEPQVPVSKPLQVTLGLSDFHSKHRQCSNQTAVRSLDEDGDELGWYHGTCQDSMFVFSTRQLGRFELAVDSLAPEISPHLRHRTAQDSILVVKAGNELRFNLSDAGVGIANFGASLDGEWILMQWDPKRERVWYELGDGRHLKGAKQRLIVTAMDEAGNPCSWEGWVQF